MYCLRALTVVPALISLTLLLVACGSQTSGSSAGIQPVYDDNTAFVLVGQEVPASERDFYLFDFSQGLTVDANANTILKKMQDNPLHTYYIGFIGPDGDRKYEIMQALMRQRGDATFPKIEFVYVGTEQQKVRVCKLLKPLQVRLHYVVYP